MESEIKKEIKIKSIRLIVNPAKNSTSKETLGFVQLELVEESGLVAFKIRGFVIKKKQFGGKEVVVLNAPAYPTKYKLVCSFFVENKELWKEIESTSISELNRIGVTNSETDNIDNQVSEIEDGINNSNY